MVWINKCFLLLCSFLNFLEPIDPSHLVSHSDHYVMVIVPFTGSRRWPIPTSLLTSSEFVGKQNDNCILVVRVEKNRRQLCIPIHYGFTRRVTSDMDPLTFLDMLVTNQWRFADAAWERQEKQMCNAMNRMFEFHPLNTHASTWPRT